MTDRPAFTSLRAVIIGPVFEQALHQRHPLRLIARLATASANLLSYFPEYAKQHRVYRRIQAVFTLSLVHIVVFLIGLVAFSSSVVGGFDWHTIDHHLITTVALCAAAALRLIEHIVQPSNISQAIQEISSQVDAEYRAPGAQADTPHPREGSAMTVPALTLSSLPRAAKETSDEAVLSPERFAELLRAEQTPADDVIREAKNRFNAQWQASPYRDVLEVSKDPD